MDKESALGVVLKYKAPLKKWVLESVKKTDKLLLHLPQY